MVRYRVKPDQTSHVEELVRALFAELDQIQPTGLRYAAFKLDDGVSFIHLIAHDTDHPLPGERLHVLRTFHEELRDRCEEPPDRTKLSVIGSFRQFEDT